MSYHSLWQAHTRLGALCAHMRLHCGVAILSPCNKATLYYFRPDVASFALVMAQNFSIGVSQRLTEQTSCVYVSSNKKIPVLHLVNFHIYLSMI